ncbi:hypothetical protein A2U01_0087423, partial [Trifolium medium]|nr:hypothetical protein [Trifolium medium]
SGASYVFGVGGLVDPVVVFDFGGGGGCLPGGHFAAPVG